MRIGVLDDNIPILECVTTMLELVGHTVSTHSASRSLLDVLFPSGIVATPLPYDLVILDEIIGAVSQGQLELDAVIELVRARPASVSVLLTGHDDREEFIERLLAIADLASEMRKVKHPFDAGRQAIKGLDY